MMRLYERPLEQWARVSVVAVGTLVTSMSAPIVSSQVTSSQVTSSQATSSYVTEGKAAFGAGEYEESMKLFAEGFAAGDSEAGYFMARQLELGLGIAIDKVAATRLYKRTAANNHVASLNRVALMHYRGEQGVAQDFKEAARFFERAGGLGDGNALFNLGKLYFEGQGVKQDTVKAIELYRQAADKDHILALNTMGGLYRLGAKSEEDRAKARAFFKRSADFGNAVGLYETARSTLEEGDTPERRVEAHMYLNLAAARAHPNAPEALQELTRLMTQAQVEHAQEKARAFKALTVADAGASSENPRGDQTSGQVTSDSDSQPSGSN